MENESRVILRTYKSVWKIPRKLYSIDSIKLFVPVDVDQAMYFIASLCIAFLLLKLLPFLDSLPFIFKYVAIPYGLMKFFTKQKLDGKLPHKFFLDYIVFLMAPGKLSRFKVADDFKLKPVKFSTSIVYRNFQVINKTDTALNTKKRRKGQKVRKGGD